MAAERVAAALNVAADCGFFIPQSLISAARLARGLSQVEVVVADPT
jgi:hypothetical protein